MAIKKIKIKSTANLYRNSQSSPSPYTPHAPQEVSSRRWSTTSPSEPPVSEDQPPLSTGSSHNGDGNIIDDTIPYYHHYHYPQEIQQQQQQPHSNAKRSSRSVRLPPSSSQSPVGPTNDPSVKTGRRITSRPRSVYDDNLLPPEPPAHASDKDIGNDGASDNSQRSSRSSDSNINTKRTSKKKPKEYDEKTEEDRRRMEQIAKEYKDVEGHNRNLENLIRCEDERFNSISRQFHHDTMDIRATDEDYSTIHNSLTILQAKVASLPLSLKPYLVDKQKVTDLFVKRWPHLEPAINHLCKRKQPESTALDNVIISQLIEKLVTELLVKFVHQAPMHIGFPASNAYLQLVMFMDAAGNHDLSLRLRQQLCKITARATTHNNDTSLLGDTIINRSVAEEKAVTIATIVEELAHFYDDPQNPTKCSDELMTRVHKIVESAAEVSLAMRSQVNPVVPLTTTAFTEGKDSIAGSELFNVQNGSTQDASTIQVLICPPFVFYEDDQRLLTMKGKAICF